MHFDSTAGAIGDPVMHHLAVGARVVVCGTASVANRDPLPLGPRVERHLLVKRASLQGFVVMDHQEHASRARGELVPACTAARTRASG